MRGASRVGIVFGWIVLLLASTGCERQFVVSSLDLQRTGWDSLVVDIRFEERSVPGVRKPVQPESTRVYLFSAAYDTLYVGPAGLVPVPDRRLGDREHLLVEACGTFGREVVCEQGAVRASPKRIRLEHDISFPEDAEYERGSYDLRITVERRAYNGPAWERIDTPGTINSYLLAYVEGARQDSVQVPLARMRGRFNLARADNYDDFRYHVQSSLYETREAHVRFDVYAGLAGQRPVRLATVEKRVREKTYEERVAEVRNFVEQGARQLLDVLDAGGNDRAARAYIEDWEFRNQTRTYVVELELVWRRDGWFFGDRYRLSGVLEVREDGTQAHFTHERSNGRAEREWRRAVDGDTLPLGSLEPIEWDDVPPGNEHAWLGSSP